MGFQKGDAVWLNDGAGELKAVVNADSDNQVYEIFLIEMGERVKVLAQDLRLAKGETWADNWASGKGLCIEVPDSAVRQEGG